MNIDPSVVQAERLTRIAFQQFSLNERAKILRNLRIFSSPGTDDDVIIKRISAFFVPLSREKLLAIESAVKALKGVLDIDSPEVIAGWTYYSGFFRDAKSWEQTFRGEVRKLIFQKVMVDDFSLTGKSVGAETGEEAYTLAFILYEELLGYYQEHREEMERRFTGGWEGWLPLWDIAIEAYDKSLMALNFLTEARYSCCDREDYFIYRNLIPLCREAGNAGI